MTHWKEVITDDFDAGYSAIAEDISSRLWDTPLINIYMTYSKEVAAQCETLLTTVLLEALIIEERKAIDSYKQAVLGINQQKEY